MKSIYVAQFGTGGNMDLLPLSAGYLLSRLKKEKDITEKYHTENILFKRENPKKLVSKMNDVHVAGFSCYLWNMNQSLETAREVKKVFPKSIIVFGGHSTPQREDESKKFLNRYEFIDVIGINEGEETFTKICKGVDFKNIPGIIYRDNNKIVRNIEEIVNLKEMPSPFLDGVFDDFYKENKNISGVIMEVTRGCPYKCSYCSWGSQKMRVRERSLEVLKDEVDWVGRKSIKYITLSDNNFGMKDIDLKFTKALAECKKKYGSPNYVSVSWAKEFTGRILEMLKIMKENDIGFKITSSSQSWNEDTLRAINRANIKKTSFKKIKDEYSKQNVLVYSELILGLPLETYDSYMKGIEKSLVGNIFCQTYIYPFFLLPNSELSKRENIIKYRIKTQKNEIAYKKNKNLYKIKELADLVIATSTMPEKNWVDAFVDSNYTLALHDNRLAFFVLNYLKKEKGINITDIVSFCRTQADHSNYPLLKNSFSNLEKYALNIQKKGDILLIRPKGYNNIPFDPPEAIFLELILKKEQFYHEFKKLIESYLQKDNFKMDKRIFDDLFNFQEAVIAAPGKIKKNKFDIKYNWIEYFGDALNKTPEMLKEKETRLSIATPIINTKEDYLKKYFDVRGTPPFNQLCDDKGQLVFPVFNKII